MPMKDITQYLVCFVFCLRFCLLILRCGSRLAAEGKNDETYGSLSITCLPPGERTFSSFI